MNRLLIVPAFAADKCGFVSQVNIPDIQPDDLDLPKPLKQKEGDPKVKDFKGSSFFVWITPDGHNERMNA